METKTSKRTNPRYDIFTKKNVIKSEDRNLMISDANEIVNDFIRTNNFDTPDNFISGICHCSLLDIASAIALGYKLDSNIVSVNLMNTPDVISNEKNRLSLKNDSNFANRITLFIKKLEDKGSTVVGKLIIEIV